MIELFFDQSSCGSFRGATMIGNRNSFQVYASIEMADRDDCAVNESVEDEEGKPISSEFSDVYGLQLGLSVGNISGCIMNNRQYELSFMFEEANDSPRLKKIMADMNADLTSIHQRLNEGEAICIWYSDVPDELCGFYWFMNQLAQWGISNVQVMGVKLPEWIEYDQRVLMNDTWGEIAPKQWTHYIHLKKRIPEEVIKKSAAYWQRLQKENAPLRAVVNGKLASVSESFYDSFIEQVILSMDKEFNENQLLSKILNQHLRIGVSFIRSRINAMIQLGKLDVIDCSINGYRRLRKNIE